jgi:glycosyltransferase involved in cell wall biosynthesis
MPIVSFCLTTYKRGEVLLGTLKSIQRQSFTDFEVIVSDNDPESSGRLYVEGMNDPRFKYFPNEKNLGMKPSFNKSIERSCGEYIVMIADDDPVYYDMLETLVSLQKQYPGYGMYLGGCDWFCSHPEVSALYKLKVGTNSCLSGVHELGFTKAYSPGEFLKLLFTFGLFPHYLWSTGMVKREVLVGFGGTPDYGTPFLGDYAYLSLMSSHSGCVVINKALGCQALHQENFGRSQNEQLVVAARNFPAYLEARIKHLKEWPEIKEHMLRFVGMWLVSHMGFLYRHVKENNLREAEKAVFDVDYMRKYRLKYYLKTRFPFLHDLIVDLKKSGKK